MKEYDIIIIGGGISGLFSALTIRKLSPTTSILILEQNNLVGGRMDTYNFYDSMVNTGAGIGRKKKDAILIKLLKEFNINYKEYNFHVKYSDQIDKKINLAKIIKLLTNKYRKNEHSHLTFKQFSIIILGNEQYQKFVTKLGFSDFEKEGVLDVLNNYGLDDNEDGWIALKIDWSILIEKIVKQIGSRYIRVNNKALLISKHFDKYFISTSKSNYFCNKIIIASTIETVSKLLPNFRIYDQVHSQSFLRVYGKFSKPIPNLDEYTIVTGPLKKIIPINIENYLYMIAYTDNDSADLLKPFTTNNQKNREYFCKLIEQALNLKDKLNLISLKSFFWKAGTHYYEPLKEPFKNRSDFIDYAQHPYQNMLVVGEMISIHQGWTLGALESVERVLNKKWIHKYN
jgi:hypothetical protein